MRIGKKQIKRELILIIVLLASMEIGLITKTGYTFLIMQMGIVGFCCYHNNVASLECFILCTVIQNIELIILAPYISSFETTVTILIKECLVYIGAFALWIRKIRNSIKLNAIDLCFLFFLIICLISIIRSGVGIGMGVTSLRQFLVPFLCYYFGSAIYKNKNTINNLFLFIIIVSIVVIIFSWIIYLSDPEEFWIGLGYKDYYFNKYGTLASFSTMNFYTFDLGTMIKRFTSIFADPLAFAHFIAVPLVFLTYLHKKGLYFTKLIFWITVVVCLSKFHVLLLAVMLCLYFYEKSRGADGRRLYKFLIAICLVVVFVVLSNYTSGLTENTSIGNHFGSLQYGLNNISLLGQGMGNAGWSAYATGAADILEGNYGESLFSTLMVQAGLLGIIPFYTFFIVLVKELYALYIERRKPELKVCFVLSVAVLIETFVSASSISMLGTGIYFVIAGLCVSFEKESQLYG